MAEYQVLARKYRPKKFQHVLGQEAIVTTLKNAIKQNRLAHAYLFCGSRGTGKTTLARVFAKALNCLNRGDDFEPCDTCSSCREIAVGSSMDVLEIDGASHRGIDDIRQINETVGYASSSGKYKIYIIDEVHMLTKEAFNALLKTLEEPPPKVMFLFATTEPHKVLPTILSRCQRFNLNRIPVEKISEKLRMITKETGVSIQEEALRMLAQRADGGLRDAESLLDQIIAFHDGEITTEIVASILGIMPRDQFFDLDKAGKESNLSIAFEIAHQVFSQGKDIVHFIESLTDHFRTILLVKLSGKNAPFLHLSPAEQERYEQSAKLYSQEQCLTLLDHLVEQQHQIRFAPSPRIALEAILLRVLRSHTRVPVDYLVRKLTELEGNFKGNKPIQATLPSMTEDPTPSRADLGLKEPAKPKVVPPPQTAAPIPEAKVERPAPKPVQPVPVEKPKPVAPIVNEPPVIVSPEKQSRYDTLLQFAAVELEGTVQRKQMK